jgi:hypothetical protein
MRCYFCSGKPHYCPMCYADKGLSHSHEGDYICEACGGVSRFLTEDELLLRLTQVDRAKEIIRAKL